MCRLVDPEMKAEFESRQPEGVMGGSQAQNPLGSFDMAAFLAGSNSKKDEAGGEVNDGRNEPVRR